MQEGKLREILRDGYRYVFDKRASMLEACSKGLEFR